MELAGIVMVDFVVVPMLVWFAHVANGETPYRRWIGRQHADMGRLACVCRADYSVVFHPAEHGR